VWRSRLRHFDEVGRFPNFTFSHRYAAEDITTAASYWTLCNLTLISPYSFTFFLNRRPQPKKWEQNTKDGGRTLAQYAENWAPYVSIYNVISLHMCICVCVDVKIAPIQHTRLGSTTVQRGTVGRGKINLREFRQRPSQVTPLPGTNNNLTSRTSGTRHWKDCTAIVQSCCKRDGSWTLNYINISCPWFQGAHSLPSGLAHQWCHHHTAGVGAAAHTEGSR